MKVALVTSIPRGGPVEHALLLGRELASAGASVSAVVATEELAQRFAAAGVQPFKLPLHHGLDGRAAWRLRAWARRADVVHSHDRRSGLLTRVLPRPSRRAALVHTIHGLPEPYLPAPIGNPHPGLRAVLAYRGLERSLARRADALLVPSRSAAGVLHERLAYPRERLIVVRNGVDVPVAAEAQGELVGTLSALEPVKGLDVFLRAVALVAERRPATRFTVQGTGTLADELPRLAARLGVSDRVSFPGFLPGAEALARLAVLVVPSWYETGSLTLLEGMAAGVPVVASRAGAIPEIAAGVVELVEPGDANAVAAAVLRLLDDPGWAVRRARAARELTSGNSAAATASAVRNVYERVLAARAAADATSWR